MTEKRFAYLDYKDTVKDNQTGKEYHTWFEDDLLGLLNSLSDENEQLKKEISNRDEVNKRLQNYNNRKRAENERLHRDWDKLYQLCLDKGFTEDELIKELER
jgi:hypothetical protein